MDGKQALDQINENPDIDVVLMDMMMPEMDGYETIRNIRKMPKYARLPIIAVTAKSMLGDRDKCIAGCFGLYFETRGYRPAIIIITCLVVRKLNLMKKKILIVDDDPRNIFALKLTLKARGYQIETSTSGQEAINILKNQDNINAVLMDMMMPDMDGYEAMKIIRRTEAIKDTAIIAVTAQAMPEDREKCLEAGADDYVTKPIDVDQLLNVIENLS
jgi:CheY-like chemotaxis protein